MKVLVFLLVLANLLFYAFTAGYFGKSGNPDAARLAQQILPERIRIVSRDEAPPKTAKAPAPVPASAPSPVAKVEPAPPVCLAWTHLSPADADRLSALLGDQFAEFSITRQADVGERQGWWVFIPPLANKAAADKKAAELRALGVSDYFVVQDGTGKLAISLGVFSSEKGARDKLAELRGKGVRSARAGERPAKDGTVGLQTVGPAASREAVLAAVAKALPQASVGNCQ